MTAPSTAVPPKVTARNSGSPAGNSAFTAEPMPPPAVCRKPDRAAPAPNVAGLIPTAATTGFGCARDRDSVVSGNSVYVREDHGGRRINKNKNHKHRAPSRYITHTNIITP